MTDDLKKPTTQPSMPAQPPTVALPAMSDRKMLEDLYKLNKEQMAALGSLTTNVSTLNHNVDLLGGQQDTIIVRMGNVERRVSDIEDRVTRNSTRARDPSAHDLTNESRIADEIRARTALANVVDKHTTQLDAIESKTDAQTAMLTTISSAVTGVTGWIKQNPTLVTTVVGLVSAGLGWLSSYIQSRGH